MIPSPTNPDDIQDQLLPLLRATLGSKIELLNYEISNQHRDYLVLLTKLRSPTSKVVIKLAGPQALIPCSFERTTALHQLVSKHTTICMPQVLAVDVSYQQWPWRYLIKEYLPGCEWATVRPQLDPTGLAAACAQIGSAVGQLHTIRFPSFGELTETANVTENQTFLAALTRRAAQTIRRARLYELFLSVLQKHESLFEDIDKPALCHEDLHKHNILFQRQGTKWRLATILDFDKAWADLSCGKT